MQGKEGGRKREAAVSMLHIMLHIAQNRGGDSWASAPLFFGAILRSKSG